MEGRGETRYSIVLTILVSWIRAFTLLFRLPNILVFRDFSFRVFVLLLFLGAPRPRFLVRIEPKACRRVAFRGYPIRICDRG